MRAKLKQLTRNGETAAGVPVTPMTIRDEMSSVNVYADIKGARSWGLAARRPRRRRIPFIR